MMFYVVPMYVSGVTQGLMWKQFTHEGFLQYPVFLETVLQLIPMYVLRAVGGTLYITGVILMAVNLYRTAKAGKLVLEEEAKAPALEPEKKAAHAHPWGHRWLEAKPLTFSVLAFVAVAIGGLIEVVPLYLIKSNVPTIASVKPYTPLEVLGRDIYIREGCVGCHSQMIRPFRSETERYTAHIQGASDLYSKAGEFIYDHPFLWGSKRTGPDLHRVGAKYPDAWHYNHMEDPRSTSPGSIMPPYPWLLEQKLDTASLPARIRALRKVGVPYPPGLEAEARKLAEAQAATVVAGLASGSVSNAPPDREIIALIAYLQRLGTDIRGSAAETPAAPTTTTAQK
jgi:cytochrome c oxidase cbb3-type subunit I/II